MKAYPLNQIDALADKSPLGMVTGTAKRIFQRKTGTKQQSGEPWSKQDFEIESDGVTVKVVVWDKEEIPRSNEGCKVTLFSKEQPGKAPSGLYVFDDTYQGKTTRKLKMTTTGLIQFEGRQSASEPAQASAPAESTSHASEPSQGSERRTSQSSAPAESDNVNEVKRELCKLANLHVLATLTVEKVIAPKFKEATGREMPEDRRGASVSSLIIAGEKRGLHLNLPSKPLEI